MYGIDVGRYHFLVSALHHGYCICCFFCSFFTTYTVRQSGCPLVGWSHVGHVWCRDDAVPVSSVCSLCLITTDSARSYTLSHCCFPFLPSSSSSPCFLSSPFSSTSFHVSATWIFVLTNLWSSGFSPCSGAHFLHINLIFFSVHKICCTHIFFHIFLVLNLWPSGFSHVSSIHLY